MRNLRALQVKQLASTWQSRIQTYVSPSPKSVLNHNVILASALPSQGQQEHELQRRNAMVSLYLALT